MTTDQKPGPSVCMEDDCDKPVHAGNRCQNHYRKFKKYGTAHPTPEMKKKPGPAPDPTKWRSRYNTENPERLREKKGRAPAKTHCPQGHEFTEENTYRSSKGARMCKECRRLAVQKYRDSDPQPSDHRYGAGNRAKTHCPKGHPYDEQNTYVTSKGTRSCRECRRVRSIYSRYSKYGLTEQDYLDLLEKQMSLCGICGTPFGDGIPHIDHCHVTQEVRGLLCGRCNTGLGQFLDNPEILQQAIDYVTNGRIRTRDSLSSA